MVISNKFKKDIKSEVLSVHLSELKGSNLEEIRTSFSFLI